MARTADEKKAFERMMAEVGDDSDDSDGDLSEPVRVSAINKKNSTTPSAAPIAVSKSDTNEHVKKLTKEELDIENFGSAAKSVDLHRQSVASTKWLSRPCTPGDPPVLCYLEREKSGYIGFKTTYRLYMETSGESAGRFLMAANKKTSSRTSYYLVSSEMDPSDRGSELVLGKVRGNAIGSQYIFYDHGLSPEKSVTVSSHRKELGLVRFDFSVSGPCKIQAWVPTVNNSNIAYSIQPVDASGTIETLVDAGRFERLISLTNKQPKWDEQQKGHVLNFEGRVTESSVKNFQLISNVTGEDVVLQFGRVGKERFSMDVRYPLSVYQAFSICLACVDVKIADRAGYDLIRGLTVSGGGEDESAASNDADAKGNRRPMDSSYKAFSAKQVDVSSSKK